MADDAPHSHDATGACAILQLPVQVLELLLVEAISDLRSGEVAQVSDARRTALSLSLVCRAFHQCFRSAVVPRLHSTAYLVCGPSEDLNYLGSSLYCPDSTYFKVLEKNPGLGHHCRTLIYRLPDPERSEEHQYDRRDEDRDEGFTLNTLSPKHSNKAETSLKNFNVSAAHLKMHQCLSNVRSLHVSAPFAWVGSDYDTTWHPIAEAVEALPTLQALSIHEVSPARLQHICGLGAIAPRIGHLMSISVKGLTPVEYTSEDISWLLPNIAGTGAFTTLHLELDLNPALVELKTADFFRWPNALEHVTITVEPALQKHYNFGRYASLIGDTDHQMLSRYLQPHAGSLRTLHIGPMELWSQFRFSSLIALEDLCIHTSALQDQRIGELLPPNLRVLTLDFGYDFSEPRNGWEHIWVRRQKEHESWVWRMFNEVMEDWLRRFVEAVAQRKVPLERIRLVNLAMDAKTRDLKPYWLWSIGANMYPWDRLERFRERFLQKAGIELEYDSPCITREEFDVVFGMKRYLGEPKLLREGMGEEDPGPGPVLNF